MNLTFWHDMDGTAWRIHYEYLIGNLDYNFYRGEVLGFFLTSFLGKNDTTIVRKYNNFLQYWKRDGISPPLYWKKLRSYQSSIRCLCLTEPVFASIKHGPHLVNQHLKLNRLCLYRENWKISYAQMTAVIGVTKLFLKNLNSPN